MGWGVYFDEELHIKEYIRTAEELDFKIKDTESALADEATRLKMLAVADPKILKDDEGDLLYSIENKIDDSLEGYRENTLRLFKLYALKDKLTYTKDFKLESVNSD